MDYTAMGVEVVYVGMFLMTLLFCGCLHLHTDDASNEVVNKGEDPKGAASIEVDTGERVESVISVSEPLSSREGSTPHFNQCSVLSAQLQALWKMLSGESLYSASCFSFMRIPRAEGAPALPPEEPG